MANFLQGLLSSLQPQQPGMLPGQPPQDGLGGLLSGLGGMLDTTNNPVKAQHFANAFSSGADDTTPFKDMPKAIEAQQKMQVLQQEAQAAEQERQQQAEQVNKTRELFQREAPDLIPWMDAGMTSQAFAEFSRRKQPQARKPPIEINGQLVDPDTYEVVGDFRDPQAGMPAAPSGYQWGPDGQSLTPIAGGPADKPPSATTTEAERRNAAIYNTVIPELAVVEENWDALSSPLDQTAGRVGARILTQEDYQQASNAVYVIAQHYLYSLSGQAAPEGEVQRVAESLMPRIGESAQAVADKKARLATYINTIKLGAGRALQSDQAAPGGQTSTGLQWSIEP